MAAAQSPEAAKKPSKFIPDAVCKVYSLRISRDVDNALTGVTFDLTLPAAFASLSCRLRLYDRIFFRVWDGQATGAAKLAKVIELRMPPTTPQTVNDPVVTVQLRMQRTWGWSYDKFDNDLKELQWMIEPDEFPVLRTLDAGVVTPIETAEILAPIPGPTPGVPLAMVPLPAAIPPLSVESAAVATAYAVCGQPQFDTPSGRACSNGHGGADFVPVTAEMVAVDLPRPPLPGEMPKIVGGELGPPLKVITVEKPADVVDALNALFV